MVRSSGWVLTVWSLFVVCGLARAEEEAGTQKARIHLRAGIADYDEGRYAEAANEMEQAYALKPLADLQYNLAQCYERLNRLDDAARAYETYLAGRKDAPDHDTVQKRIDNLRARARGAAVLATPIEGKVIFKTIVVYRESPPPPGRAARWAAYALGALGVAGLGCGIAFAVLTARASDDVRAAGSVTHPPVFDSDLRAKQDAAHLYPIGTGIGFAVGGLALGGAVGLWFVGRKIDREAQRQRDHEQVSLPSVAPFFAQKGAATIVGLAVSGAF